MKIISQQNSLLYPFKWMVLKSDLKKISIPIFIIIGAFFLVYSLLFQTYTLEQVVARLQNPNTIHLPINFQHYRRVDPVHLLVSGKLFPDDLERTTSLLDAIQDHLDFLSIDESNLWKSIFQGGCSGNNVLKSAVAGASFSITGKPENRKIVEKLLAILKNKDKELIEKVLNARDNFPLGGHTIAEFLVCQGNEDLAKQAIEMGGEITDQLVILAAASAGTTEYGTRLIQFLLEQRKVPFDLDVSLKIRLSLLAHSKTVPLINDLLDLNPSIEFKTYEHLQTIKFHSIEFHNTWFMPFGFMSAQYRKPKGFFDERETTSFGDVYQLFLALQDPSSR